MQKTTQDASKPVVAESGSKQVVDKSVTKSNTGFSKLFAGAVAKPKVESATNKTPKNEEVETVTATKSNSSEHSPSKNSKSQLQGTSTVAKNNKLTSSSAKSSKSAVEKASPKKETKSKQENK